MLSLQFQGNELHVLEPASRRCSEDDALLLSSYLFQLKKCDLYRTYGTLKYILSFSQTHELPTQSACHLSRINWATAIYCLLQIGHHVWVYAFMVLCNSKISNHYYRLVWLSSLLWFTVGENNRSVGKTHWLPLFPDWLWYNLDHLGLMPLKN